MEHLSRTIREELDACLVKIGEIEKRAAAATSVAERESYSLRLSFLRGLEGFLRSREEDN